MRKFKQCTVFVAILAIIASIAAMLPTQAQAQATGDTEVRVVVPPILILYYYSQLTVTLSATDLLPGGNDAIDMGAAAVTLTGWTADAGMTPTPPAVFSAAQTVTITNAWGFWGVGNQSLDADIAGGAGEALELELGGAGAATSVIDLSNFQLQYAPSALGPASTLAGLPKGFDGGAVRTGDLLFNIDLSQVTDTGTFSDAEANPQFTITLAYN